jgi:hypothetical protein
MSCNAVAGLAICVIIAATGTAHAGKARGQWGQANGDFTTADYEKLPAVNWSSLNTGKGGDWSSDVPQFASHCALKPANSRHCGEHKSNSR